MRVRVCNLDTEKHCVICKKMVEIEDDYTNQKMIKKETMRTVKRRRGIHMVKLHDPLE